MTVHLIKLCVGVDTVQELKAWQAERLRTLRKAGKTPELRHRTLQTPRRRDQILDGGSLYWVVKGFVLVRQRVLDLKPDRKDDGTACCAIVLDPELVTTRPQARRAFQGWRYLDAADAPQDRGRVADDRNRDMPVAMRAALRELRLIDN
jgi:hypothetical protein